MGNNAKTGSLRKESLRNLLVDAGAVYLNYGEEDERLLGATQGGASFNVEQEVREIEVDGARGPIKGGRRVVEEHARITVNLMEMTPENLEIALFGAEASDNGSDGGKKVTRSISTPGDSAYFKNIALVGDIAGSSEPAIFLIKNAMADGNFELTTEDQDEAAVEVQFTAHFDPEALHESPWEIRMPALTEDDGSDNGGED